MNVYITHMFFTISMVCVSHSCSLCQIKKGRNASLLSSAPIKASRSVRQTKRKGRSGFKVHVFSNAQLCCLAGLLFSLSLSFCECKLLSSDSVVGLFLEVNQPVIPFPLHLTAAIQTSIQLLRLGLQSPHREARLRRRELRQRQQADEEDLADRMKQLQAANESKQRQLEAMKKVLFHAKNLKTDFLDIRNHLHNSNVALRSPCQSRCLQ